MHYFTKKLYLCILFGEKNKNKRYEQTAKKRLYRVKSP